VADPNTPPSPAPTRFSIDRVKNGAAVRGAITAAVTGLWGVYEKARSEAKSDTASSYNTLAPQVNQMGDALKQLQQENQQLRELVANFQGQPRIAAVPARKPSSGRRPPATARPGEPAASAPAGAPAATPPAETPPAAPPPAPQAQTGTGGAPAPPAQPGTEPPAEAKPTDPVGGLLNTVGRTREAIEGLRKVPEDFEKVVGKKK